MRRLLCGCGDVPVAHHAFLATFGRLGKGLRTSQPVFIPFSSVFPSFFQLVHPVSSFFHPFLKMLPGHFAPQSRGTMVSQSRTHSWAELSWPRDTYALDFRPRADARHDLGRRPKSSSRWPDGRLRSMAALKMRPLRCSSRV